MDLVWSAVRAAGLRTGHNVFVYRATETDEYEMEMGVQILDDGELPPGGEVAMGETPSGSAAHTLHIGPYDGLPEAFAAIHAWAARENVRTHHVGWEVYGDWAEDASKLETDVYYLLA
jgi:effector-binding domain-containing protein